MSFLRPCFLAGIKATRSKLFQESLSTSWPLLVASLFLSQQTAGEVILVKFCIPGFLNQFCNKRASAELVVPGTIRARGAVAIG